MRRRPQTGEVLSPEAAVRKTRYLYYWLLLALFFEYARPASFVPIPGIGVLYSVIPLSLMAVTFFAAGTRPWGEIFADKLAKWPLIFLGLIVFSTVHADVTMYVFNTFKTVLGYVFLYFMVVRICITADRVRGVVAMLMIAHLFLLAMNPSVVTQPESRNYIIGASFLGDGNDFSLSLCLLTPMIVELAQRVKHKWLKLAVWGGAGVLLLAIIGTQSRGASIGVAAVCVFLWLNSSRKALGIVGVALVGVVVLIYAPPQYFDRMKTITAYQEDGSAQGRIEAWKASINMAKDNPLLGVGAGQFPTAFGTKYRTPGAMYMPWLTAHSSYFLVLGELGLPGVICLLVLIIGNVRANKKLRRVMLERAGPEPPEAIISHTRMLFWMSASAIGLGVAGAFLSAAYYPHFYVLAGMCVSARCAAANVAGLKPADWQGAARPTGRRRRTAPATTARAA